MTPDQIQADQLQIDSSLSAINQIANTTSFQGQNLLNGSLGFNVNQGSGSNNIASLQINQANLSAGPQNVAVNVTAAAQAAQLDANNIASGSGATAAAATATIALTGGTITVTAPDQIGAYNGVAVNFVEQSGVNAARGPTASYNASTGASTLPWITPRRRPARQSPRPCQRPDSQSPPPAARNLYAPAPTLAQSTAATLPSSLVTFADGGQLQITGSTTTAGDTVTIRDGRRRRPHRRSLSGTTLTVTLNKTAGSTTPIEKLPRPSMRAGSFTATVVKPGDYQQGTDVLAAGGWNGGDHDRRRYQRSRRNRHHDVHHDPRYEFHGDGEIDPGDRTGVHADRGVEPPAGGGKVSSTSPSTRRPASPPAWRPFKPRSPSRQPLRDELQRLGPPAVVGSGTTGTLVTTRRSVRRCVHGLSTTMSAGTAAVTGADTTFSGGCRGRRVTE